MILFSLNSDLGNICPTNKYLPYIVGSDVSGLNIKQKQTDDVLMIQV